MKALLRCNLVPAVVIVFMGILIGANLLCSCAKKNVVETFQDLNKDTTNSYLNNLYKPLQNNVGGTVPLQQDQLAFFSENQFKPECCTQPQQYSSSTGCACISIDQMKYLNSRGGNNNLPG